MITYCKSQEWSSLAENLPSMCEACVSSEYRKGKRKAQERNGGDNTLKCATMTTITTTPSKDTEVQGAECKAVTFLVNRFLDSRTRACDWPTCHWPSLCLRTHGGKVHLSAFLLPQWEERLAVTNPKGSPSRQTEGLGTR